MNLKSKAVSILIAALLMAGTCAESLASDRYVLSRGETVYVSVYSNVFSAPKQMPFYLGAILSIRNTDLSNSFTVVTADYYDTKGRLLKQYYQKPVTLAPLESVHIFIPEDDIAGGVGANFIVKWKAAQEINMPIIESVMIGEKSGKGISFVVPGQVIKENTR